MKTMWKKTGLFIVLYFLSLTSLSASQHELFNRVLAEHVRAGEVNYSAIRKDERFYDYLDFLADARPESFSSENKKLAFWINAYNALAIKGILDGLSPDGFFSRITFFKSTRFRLAGKEISLYDLEHKIIIPFREPLIHFAIVCASRSCPKLVSQVYTAENLESELQSNARAFINNRDKNRFDSDKKVAQLSKIFDWYEKDFSQHAGSVQKFIALYVSDSDLSELLVKDSFRLKYLVYDWSLNGELEN